MPSLPVRPPVRTSRDHPPHPPHERRRHMQLGLGGLGKMRGNMRERIRRAGHEVVGFDNNPAVSDVKTLAALVKKLDAPRTVWVMVPSGEPTRATGAKLAGLLDKGDLVIDGGNSRFTDDFENEA